MAQTEREVRASNLAEKALTYISCGKAEVCFFCPSSLSFYLFSSYTKMLLVQDASRALREAFSIAPENAKVKDAFLTIQDLDLTHPLLLLCESFAEKQDAAAGVEAQWHLSGGLANHISPEIAAKCFELVVKATKSDSGVRDDLLASLIQFSLAVRRHLAEKLQGRMSRAFDEIFFIGDGAANSITVVTLDPHAWKSDVVRSDSLKAVFQLFLAKFLESGHDYDGRALKGIARYLIADGANLVQEIDQETFEAILYCLDYRLGSDVRNQAFLATAKYLELAKETAEQCLVKFIRERTAKHATEDLVKAFSAAAAVFPLATPIVASLFLTEGFLASLVPMLDKKSRPIKVEKAALDMLSAACIDRGCREAIRKYCTEWMHHVMDDEEDERHGQAAVILAKVQNLPNTPPQTPGESRVDTGNLGSFRPRGASKNIADVVPTLKAMFLKGGEMERRTAIEGLAYASVQPIAKDEITRDPEMLKELFKTPGKDSLSATAAFGILTLVDNLTRYLPTMTEDQRRLAELKAYANASTPSIYTSHHFDEDDSVTNRCKWLLDSKVTPFLVSLRSSFVTNSLSPASFGLYARILLSLARAPAHRGTMAQQGTIPLILNISSTNTVDETSKYILAHALARILISCNPTLISKYTTSAVARLVTLLSPPEANDNDTRDLLPTFEGLLALTNLASDPTLLATKVIIREAQAQLEDVILSSNELVQRAAAELICNMVNTPDGMELLADGSPAANRRLHIILALTDAQDDATRRAAGGSLASVTIFDSVVKFLVERKRGIELILRMCKDDNMGVVHRGIVCVRNIVSIEDSLGEQARSALNRNDAPEILLDVIRRNKDKEVIELAADSIKILSE